MNLLNKRVGKIREEEKHEIGKKMQAAIEGKIEAKQIVQSIGKSRIIHQQTEEIPLEDATYIEKNL